MARSLELLEDGPLTLRLGLDARAPVAHLAVDLAPLRSRHYVLPLALLLDQLGHQLVAVDAVQLLDVLVAVDQLAVVVELLALTRQQPPDRLRRVRLPNADVGVVAPAEHKVAVAGEHRREHALHALRVVHLVAAARPGLEQADRAVVARRRELLAGRRVRHVHDRGHV
eukprot:CAMPEP_0202042510 /NCGR_PEP_ID=MMETSP0962-20130828/27504_1 /ASSEMBLY_ACC=CAM_ASM_000488 /TAXON_ID=4773 /ORGANISM="Schizochytrium aggregatum, Strain ATCC28209" /LENGTH=168 /DNA_ID=CAMNT_0048606915 /DNA_START=15 /DNA_END=517 /DNA_ORIENTATION=+